LWTAFILPAKLACLLCGAPLPGSDRCAGIRSVHKEKQRVIAGRGAKTGDSLHHSHGALLDRLRFKGAGLIHLERNATLRQCFKFGIHQLDDDNRDESSAYNGICA